MRLADNFPLSPAVVVNELLALLRKRVLSIKLHIATLLLIARIYPVEDVAVAGPLWLHVAPVRPGHVPVLEAGVRTAPGARHQGIEAEGCGVEATSALAWNINRIKYTFIVNKPIWIVGVPVSLRSVMAFSI